MDGNHSASSRAFNGSLIPTPAENPQGSVWAGTGVAPQWHPKIARFFLYWRSIHPASGLPGRQHFDPLAIHSLLPGIWLLDVQREPFRLRYRLVGTEAVDAIGAEVTGQWMDEAHTAVAQQPGSLDRYRTVVEQKLPTWRRGTPLLSVQQKYTTLENLVVPLATDGVTVDVLAALTVFQAQSPYAMGE